MKNIMDNYQAGVNLGGWISQYRTYDHDHFKSFIVEEDIKQIASWGMDHVRLPINYRVLEDDNKPFEYKESGLAYVDSCLKWCKKYGLNLILDLHEAPGYFFGTLDSNSLFTDRHMKDRFIGIWTMFAERYKSEGDNLIFELLNEVVEPNSDRWNELAHETIKEIHKIDEERYIIYGGNHYSAIYELKNIDVLKDSDRIIYTYHFYHPFLFTHQRAGWSQICVDFDATIDYPGMIPGLKEFLDAYPQYKAGNDFFLDHEMNKKLMEGDMQPALDFMEATGKPVYCGEYGVIDVAPMQSRINWHRDFIDITKKHKIGRAVWSYKLMNFALVDENSKPVSEELIRIVSEK